MRSDDIVKALDSVGNAWTQQIKREERSASARSRRASMYSSYARISLKELCEEHMEDVWEKASDGGRLPTHWRQLFYLMRPLLEGEADRPLTDATFKGILEGYLERYEPGWDVLRGARGVFKEPHSARDDSGLPMSTLAVRDYLNAARAVPDGKLPAIAERFPTQGARNRIAAILICEKEGFDELLQAEQVPERYDLALMSTKGISVRAARELAAQLNVPCFTLHDLDKNGFLMAAGFRSFATDIGLRMTDVEQWGLEPEEQRHRNPHRTARTLIRNGATREEASFIAQGQRVELNMLTGADFVRFVEEKLDAHGVEKVIPDDETLAAAWRRAHLAKRINQLIENTWSEEDAGTPMPANLASQIANELDADETQSWDEALWHLVDDVAEEQP